MSNDRIAITKGTSIGFFIFSSVLACYIVLELLHLNIFSQRELSAIMGSAIIILLLGFIIDQLHYRGFNFWALGAIISFTGVLIFFSPIILYGLENNDTTLWLILVVIGIVLIIFGYTVEAYELNNKIAKIMINLWDAVVNYQWQKIPGKIALLISVIFYGLFSYAIRGIKQIKRIIKEVLTGSYNFIKISILRLIDLVLEIPNMIIKMVRLFYSQSFWLIPAIIIIVLNYNYMSNTLIGNIALVICLVLIFLIAISFTNQNRMQQFTTNVVNRSWETIQTVTVKIQEVKQKIGKYKCLECNKPINLDQQICENCKTPFGPTEAQLMELQLTPDDVKGKKFYYGRGCDKCNGTGYRGRTGIFEIMVFNDELRDLIMNQASTAVLRAAGQKAGMRLLRDNGLATIYDGITTIDEVAKETLMEEM